MLATGFVSAAVSGLYQIVEIWYNNVDELGRRYSRGWHGIVEETHP
jgi:hypothetical protein